MEAAASASEYKPISQICDGPPPPPTLTMAAAASVLRRSRTWCRTLGWNHRLLLSLPQLCSHP